ncbi:MAG TPA: DUF924 family protein [Ramlibacter sp.]|nr:DUF924 family protein [Ramlibacter sp.]
MTVLPEHVTAFWREAGPSRWFRKDEAFDAGFRNRFLEAHEAAMRGDLDAWAREAEGALALLILLDQFPRNAFRGTARMYESDAKARAITRAAIDAGFDRVVEPELRNFFYLPLMHSESLADQESAVELARGCGGEALRYALQHRDIVAKFGRFPHRNALLGRTSTPEEEHFLANGGFAG